MANRRRSSHPIRIVVRRGFGWIPWQAIVSRIAKGQGFIDPGTVLKRLRGFAKPSEVGEPIELLRAGVVFHARGLVNTRAIQFNLDWVWPFWVEQQFNPNSDSFIPRAFSFSHINLTHRNWTAVGLPDIPHYSIVDPRGLVTPHFDGWSLDFWIVGGDGALLPSKTAQAKQVLSIDENISVRTEVHENARRLVSTTRMEADERGVWCVIRVQADAPEGTQLVAAIRPYNPEGVSFIDSIRWAADARTFEINGLDQAMFSRTPVRAIFSCYEQGDVFAALDRPRADDPERGIECSVGMATAAALFDPAEELEVRIPVEEAGRPNTVTIGASDVPGRSTWRDELKLCAKLTIPNPRLQQLYDAAIGTLILHAPGEVFPGPYTYKRFWYRDAALILNALLSAGHVTRVRKALDLFPRGQMRDGYFRSQEGEWDSNGQVLWILDRYCALSNQSTPPPWLDAIRRGAEWILDKRMGPESPHPGLLPAGFSAEHLGPNDYYYWDDFWGIAGLRAAGRMLRASNAEFAKRFEVAADDFHRAVFESVKASMDKTGGAIPAAPGRRMDSGAVGSLVGDFPLQLVPPGDSMFIRSVEWMLAHSFVRGGFFQNMIHSGINAYLTLHVAQVLLRAGDPRFRDLMESVAALASPTGQWPEAIHPRTLGGCMGDGQHVWAAAEWVLMLHHCFVREEQGTLVVGSGLCSEWITAGECGVRGVLTSFGQIDVCVRSTAEGHAILEITGKWHREAPSLQVRVPGFKTRALTATTFELIAQ